MPLPRSRPTPPRSRPPGAPRVAPPTRSPFLSPARRHARRGDAAATAARDRGPRTATSDRAVRARASRSRAPAGAWRTSAAVALLRRRPAESTSSRAGPSRGSMVKRVARILVRERPGRLDVEAMLVDHEPVRVIAIEDRDVSGAEEAVDRQATAVRSVRPRVGDVGGRRGGDVDRREALDAVARLQVGEDDGSLRNVAAEGLQEPRGERVAVGWRGGAPAAQAV